MLRSGGEPGAGEGTEGVAVGRASATSLISRIRIAHAPPHPAAAFAAWGRAHLFVEGTPVKDHLVFYSEGQFKRARFRKAKLVGKVPAAVLPGSAP